VNLDKLQTLVIVGALLATSPALAIPREGEAAPSARVEDADGHATDLKAFAGRPILIVYEDRDSAKQNEALKAGLAEVARGDRYRARVVLAAVADVSAWNFWPAKGFVKDAIRDESRRQGTTIYCDWTGAFRSTYQLRRGASNVVLVGRDGRVLFAAEGAVSAGERTRLFNLLREQVEKP
jgi:predicted transcriptional regulator